MADTRFDLNFGARPLKSAIQKYVQDPISLKLLAGFLKEGFKVVVDLDEKMNLVLK